MPRRHKRELDKLQDAIRPGVQALDHLDASHARDAMLAASEYQAEVIRRSFRYVDGKPGRAMFNLLKYCLGREKLIWRVHGPMCAAFEADYYGLDAADWAHNTVRQYLNEYPRGSYKTSVITTGGPIWIFLQNLPSDTADSWSPPPSFNGKKGYDQRILLGHEVEEKVKDFLESIKHQLEANDMLIRLFGQIAPRKRVEGKWTTEQADILWRKDRVPKEKNLNITSMDKALNSGHYDVAILDDMISEKKVTSREVIEGTYQFHRNMSPIMERPAIMEYIGTIWDDKDLYSYLESGEGGRVIVRRESAEALPEEIEAGKPPLWFPEVLSREFLDNEKIKLGPWFYNAQLNNRVIDDQTAMFKSGYFKENTFVLPADPDGLRIWLRDMRIFTTADPARSKAKRGCKAVVLTCAWDYLGNCYLLDLFAKKGVDPEDFLSEIFRQNRVWHPSACGVEEDGLQGILEFAARQMSRDYNEYPPWYPLRSGGRTKEFRIEGLQPLCSQRRFWWQAHQTSIIDEFTRYPRGTTRDEIDALAYQKDIAILGVKPADTSPRTDDQVLAEQAAKAAKERIRRLRIGGAPRGRDWYSA